MSFDPDIEIKTAKAEHRMANQYQVGLSTDRLDFGEPIFDSKNFKVRKLTKEEKEQVRKQDAHFKSLWDNRVCLTCKSSNVLASGRICKRCALEKNDKEFAECTDWQEKENLKYARSVIEGMK